MSGIEPPEDLPSYLEMKYSCTYLKRKEEEARQKGFFNDFNIPDLH
jgi:hypothetical protein